MEHPSQKIGLILLFGLSTCMAQSPLTPIETGQASVGIQPQAIFSSTWQSFNHKYHLFSDTMLTGNYHDTDFINAIGEDIFAQNDSGRLVWYPVDLLKKYAGTFFKPFIPRGDHWHTVEADQPLKLLSGMVSQSEPDDLALSYVKPLNDTLPAIVIFKGKYNPGFRLFKRRDYVLILALFRDGDRTSCQYQVVVLTPNPLKDRQIKHQISFPYGLWFKQDVNPSQSSHNQRIRIQRTFDILSQSLRDSLFQWIISGPHRLKTYDNIALGPRIDLPFPENWDSLNPEKHHQFLVNTLHPEKWVVVKAEVTMRPWALFYFYKFVLQSKENREEQYNARFSIRYYDQHYRKGVFEGVPMILDSLKQVDHE
ncbi:MAG: hypothetical protein K9N36_08930 [Candidatus Marinimicrobia bacterium]|nr:hypothetical protein [Candidatus Neomarinimicrobiota bacterium]